MSFSLRLIVGDGNTTPPTEAKELKMLKIKVSKALYFLIVTIEDKWLRHIKSVKKPNGLEQASNYICKDKRHKVAMLVE